jgi:succinyl-CoA synthetase beta subunit
MMTHEYQAKEILATFGIRVPRERVVRSPREAAASAREFGLPVAIKARVLVGGRARRAA